MKHSTKILFTFTNLDAAIANSETLSADCKYYAKRETDNMRALHSKYEVRKYLQCADGNTYYTVTAHDGLKLLHKIDYIDCLHTGSFRAVEVSETEIRATRLTQNIRERAIEIQSFMADRSNEYNLFWAK